MAQGGNRAAHGSRQLFVALSAGWLTEARLLARQNLGAMLAHNTPERHERGLHLPDDLPWMTERTYPRWPAQENLRQNCASAYVEDPYERLQKLLTFLLSACIRKSTFRSYYSVILYRELFLSHYAMKV
jgi:hypothetical protein